MRAGPPDVVQADVRADVAFIEIHERVRAVACEVLRERVGPVFATKAPPVHISASPQRSARGGVSVAVTDVHLNASRVVLYADIPA